MVLTVRVNSTECSVDILLRTSL